MPNFDMAVFLPAALELWSVYLTGLLVALMAYQQWRLYRFRQHAAQREELFRIVAENAADMIALVDLKGRRLYNSPAYQRILGYSAKELAKTSALEQVHPEDRYKVLEAAREARRSGNGQKLQYRIRHKDGRWRTLESTASTIRNQQGEVEKLVIVNRDVTERKLSEEQLEHHSLYDPLTGLPNRRLFLNRLQHSFARAQRNPEYHYAILLLDIDGFKTINQDMGDEIGDRILVEFSQRVKACLRENDTVARPTGKLPSSDPLLPRSGGDEFATLLEATPDPSDALRTARRIATAVAAPFSVAGRSLQAGVSIGIALSTSTEGRAEALLDDADRALHRAKAMGGSRCEMFDEGMHARAVARLKLEDELRDAVVRGQLPLCYQPIVNLESRRIIGFEALLRWHHPDQGVILPGKFFEVAEDIGLTTSLGKLVIHEACHQICDWQRRHTSLSPLSMTVNLSAKQLAHPDLVKDIRKAIQETHIEPSQLQLEVAESVMVADPRFTLDTFTQLKHTGARISIGDFGTGQSSLSLLRRLPIDELKIDRSIIHGIPADSSSCDIAGLILTVAHYLQLKVVAEGIETAVQLDRLRKLGCELGQGYYFSPPLDDQHAEHLLREQPPRHETSVAKLT